MSSSASAPGHVGSVRWLRSHGRRVHRLHRLFHPPIRPRHLVLAAALLKIEEMRAALARWNQRWSASE
ncbi:MAG: hypothetical protein ACLQGV_09095 [Bryobacteraceae bacterium]